MSERIVHYGSDIKVALHLDFGDIPAEDIPFEVVFYLGNSSLTLNKEQLIKVDDQNYIACIKSPDTRKGVIRAYVKAQLPDLDFADGIQNVVTPIEADINIV